MRRTDSLKIVLVATQKYWHGGEQQASLLLDGLRQRGHDCRVLARQGGRFALAMQRSGFRVATFLGRGRLPGPLWQIRRVLADWRPDVLYMNDAHAVTSAGLASVGLPITKRVAVRRVDFPIHNPARYRRFCDHLICVSHAVQAVCRQSGVPAHLMTVIHDACDRQRFTARDPAVRRKIRQQLGIPPTGKLLLTVARLADHKGHRFLIDAMPEILRRQENTVLALAGDGQLWDSLRAQTRRLGLNDQILFLGFRDDVPELMSAADCLVVPSHLEGLCSSIIDAMIAQLPVVATTAGGIPDLLAGPLISSSCGWLVAPRDPEALAAGVTNVFRFPHLTRQLVAAAKRRAEQQFTADRMVDRTLQLLRPAQRVAA